MLESEIETLLARFTKLRHLILDGCGMKRLEAVDGEWFALGKNCSLVGVKRAKDRERKLKVWLEANAVRSAVIDNEQSVAEGVQLNGQDGIRRRRPGRRGLATATISLRETSGRDISLPPVRPSVAIAQVTKIRILPPLPTLTSLAIATSSGIPPDRYLDIRTNFERGWTEGLAQLMATRRRLRQSWQNGIRVVRFAKEGSMSEEGLDGLVDMDSGNEIDFSSATAEAGKIPLLCLAGAGRKDDHVEDCGHMIGWDIWKDDL